MLEVGVEVGAGCGDQGSWVRGVQGASGVAVTYGGTEGVGICVEFQAELEGWVLVGVWGLRVSGCGLWGLWGWGWPRWGLIFMVIVVAGDM